MRFWDVDVIIKLSVCASSQAEAAEAVYNGLRDGRYTDTATLKWAGSVEKVDDAQERITLADCRWTSTCYGYLLPRNKPSDGVELARLIRVYCDQRNPKNVLAAKFAENGIGWCMHHVDESGDWTQICVKKNVDTIGKEVRNV